MPRYLYHCSKCKKDYEKEYSFGKAAKQPSCSKCKTAMSRVFTLNGFVLKGSGYYRNQNKHKEALGKDKEGNWKYDRLRKYDGTI